MSRPLFAVGEVVLLQSKDCPELNGEYDVLAALGTGEIFTCTVTGALIEKKSPGISYVLNDGQIDDDGLCILWHESALRKRHQPGEYSFDGLKQILAMPVSRGDFA